VITSPPARVLRARKVPSVMLWRRNPGLWHGLLTVPRGPDTHQLLAGTGTISSCSSTQELPELRFAGSTESGIASWPLEAEAS
jgi:hypothetical protein